LTQLLDVTVMCGMLPTQPVLLLMQQSPIGK